MSLSSEDLLQLIMREREEVIFERTDPRDDYFLKDEEKDLKKEEKERPLLEAGRVYKVQRIELSIHGAIHSDEYQKSAENLVKRMYILPYAETSKIIIDGYVYSPFCFRLAKP